MSTTALATWTLVALLGVITPGLDTMLVLRHTVLSGGRAGLSVVVGVALGCLVWATASLAGLTAVLTASRLAYDVVRIAGAVYLVWLGVMALRRTMGRHRRAAATDDDPVGDARPANGLRAGFVTNLLNPKVGVFYISLLPQFLPVGPGATAWGGVLVAIHIGVTLAWYPLLVALAARARGLLLRDRVRRWCERVTAVLLIGVGVRLATESR